MERGVRGYLHSDSDNSSSLFSEIYKMYRLQMLRIARYYISDNALAEDVVSDIFAKLWETRSDLTKIRDIRSYLFVIVKRKCLDETSKHSYKKKQDLETIAPNYAVNFKSPETAYLNKELAERINISLQKLPDKCRMVFLLIKEDKLRYKEVAQILNISEKTVEMHVGNALKALRKDLEAYAMSPGRRVKQTLTTIVTLILFLI